MTPYRLVAYPNAIATETLQPAVETGATPTIWFGVIAEAPTPP